MERNDSTIVFFNRVGRYPAWLHQERPDGHFPVTLVTNPRRAEPLRQLIDWSGAGRYRYVAFDTNLGNQEYRIVARLKYGNSHIKQPQSVTGFTVEFLVGCNNPTFLIYCLKSPTSPNAEAR